MESSYTTELVEKLADLESRRSFLCSEAACEALEDEIRDTEDELDQSRVSDEYNVRIYG